MTAFKNNPSPSAPKPVSSAVDHFTGVDVAKESLVAWMLPVDKSRVFPNTPTGHGEFIAWLQPFAPQKIMLEATGGYEQELLWALLEAGLPAIRVNPRQTHHARQMLSQHDKTDLADAAVLAWMAEHMQLRTPPPPSQKLTELRDLVSRRAQLVKMRTAEKNRKKQCRLEVEELSLKRHMKFLKQEIQTLEAAIGKLVQADDEWNQTAALLRSIPGVGPTTSHVLIAELPELGQANRAEITALAGLAPRAVQSGPYDGPRHIRGGRAPVRTALYMATVCALRCNSVIKGYYAHLRKQGKKAKVALTACMRKLLIILNSILKAGQPWRPALANTPPGTPEKG